MLPPRAAGGVVVLRLSDRAQRPAASRRPWRPRGAAWDRGRQPGRASGRRDCAVCTAWVHCALNSREEEEEGGEREREAGGGGQKNQPCVVARPTFLLQQERHHIPRCVIPRRGHGKTLPSLTPTSSFSSLDLPPSQGSPLLPTNPELSPPPRDTRSSRLPPPGARLPPAPCPAAKAPCTAPPAAQGPASTELDTATLQGTGEAPAGLKNFILFVFYFSAW